MNEKGDTRDDLRLPDGELNQKITEEFKKEDNTVIVSLKWNSVSNWLMANAFVSLSCLSSSAGDSDVGHRWGGDHRLQERHLLEH